MPAKILTLWMPDFLSTSNLQSIKAEQGDLFNAGLCPALNRLLSKADKLTYSPTDFYHQASQLCHLSETLPIAPTLASVECAEFDEDYFWVKIDPVQMIPDRDTLVLFPPASLNITLAEANALIESFNQHFQQDKVEIILGSASSWYLKIVQPVDIQSTLLDKVASQSIQESLPRGNAATYWKQLINETQMLFYSHPVNEKRRDLGQPEINSVWVWGEGQLTQAQKNANPLMQWQLFSESPYLHGLAKLLKGKIKMPPKNAQAWWALAEKQRHLIHFKLKEPGEQVRFEDWQQQLNAFEENWFAPLLELLKAGQIQSLLLDFGDGKRFHLTPKHLKKFWRFNRSFSAWF